MSLNMFDVRYIPLKINRNLESSTNETLESSELSKEIDENHKNYHRSVGEQLVKYNESLENEQSDNYEALNEKINSTQSAINGLKGKLVNYEQHDGQSKTIGKNMVENPIDFSYKNSSNNKTFKLSKQMSDMEMTEKNNVEKFIPVRKNDNMFKQLKSNSINKNYIDKLCKGC